MTAAGSRRGSKIAVFTLVAGATLALLLAACSDDPQAAGGLSPNAEAGATPEAAAVDVLSIITARPDLCMSLTRGGNAVPEVELYGEAPPPLGGKIAPGTYDLTQLNVYAAPIADAGDDPPTSRLTGQAAQATVVVTANELRFVEARGTMTEQVATLSPETTHAALYRVDGMSLVMTLVCPTTAAPAPTSFSAVGAGLAIFRDSKHRELYVLRK